MVIVITKGRYIIADDNMNYNPPSIEIISTLICFVNKYEDRLFYISYDTLRKSIHVTDVYITRIDNPDIKFLFQDIEKSWNNGYDQELFDMYLEQLIVISDKIKSCGDCDIENLLKSHFMQNCKK